MKLKLLFFILMCFILRTATHAQVQKHNIKLSFDLKPYISKRDIEAKVFINKIYRTSLKADNSNFVRINAQIPKLQNDSIIEIQVVINKPKGYITWSAPMPIRYTEGFQNNIRIASTKWLIDNGLTFIKQLLKSHPSEGGDLAASLLKENIYKDSKDEVELTKITSEVFLSKGDFEKSFDTMFSISVNKISDLDNNSQIKYFNSLLKSFDLSISNDTLNSEKSDYLSQVIVEDSNASQKWNGFLIKFLSSSASKDINKSLFTVPATGKSVAKKQLTTVALKLGYDIF